MNVRIWSCINVQINIGCGQAARHIQGRRACGILLDDCVIEPWQQQLQHLTEDSSCHLALCFKQFLESPLMYPGPAPSPSRTHLVRVNVLAPIWRVETRSSRRQGGQLGLSTATGLPNTHLTAGVVSAHHLSLFSR